MQAAGARDLASKSTDAPFVLDSPTHIPTPNGAKYLATDVNIFTVFT